jgi:hypothetical protein
MSRIRKTSLNVQVLRAELMSGLPLSIGAVTDQQINRWLNAAEDQVERDLDMFISPRTVYCVHDQYATPESNTPYYISGPLDKPRNWFAGNRHGALKLPRGMGKKITSIKFLPTTGLVVPLIINLNDENMNNPFRRIIRLKNSFVRFVDNWWRPMSGPMFNGYSGLGGWFFPFSQYDNMSIPGGIEIVYEAGLTPYQLENDFAGIEAMVLIQAQIAMLISLQYRTGRGAQAETLVEDALQNKLEYAKRDGFGPYGGEIKALKDRYKDLLAAFRTEFNWIWL